MRIIKVEEKRDKKRRKQNLRNLWNIRGPISTLEYPRRKGERKVQRKYLKK